MIAALRAVHIAAAAVALLSFPLPLLSAKGGRRHRAGGWSYAVSMAIVSLSAIAISVYRLATEVAPARKAFAALLLYVSVLTLAFIAMGLRVLHEKTRAGASTRWSDFAPPFLLVAGGGALAFCGLAWQSTLLMGFAPVGIFTGVRQAMYWLRAPQTRMHWWLEHMGAMLGSLVTMVTATLVVNAPRLGLGRADLVVWFLPGAVIVPATLVWQRYYAKRFARAERAPSSDALHAGPAA